MRRKEIYCTPHKPPEGLDVVLLGADPARLANGTLAYFTRAESGVVPLGLTAVDPPASAREPGSGVSRVVIAGNPDFSQPQDLPFGPAAAVLLPSPGEDGEKPLYVRFFDRAGNAATITDEAGLPRPITIVLDTRPPRELSLSLRTLSSNAPPDPAYTATLEVLASLTATDENAELLQFSISNDPGFRGAGYEPFTTARPFVLLPGDGEKRVYVRFRDAAGNEVTLPPASIYLDSQPPGSPSAELSSPSANRAFVSQAATLPDGLKLAVSAIDAYRAGSRFTVPRTGERASRRPRRSQRTWSIVSAFER